MRRLALVLLASGGCSFIAARGDINRDPHRGDPPIKCTQAHEAPVADAVLAALLVGIGGAVASADSAKSCGTCDEQGFPTVFVALPLVAIGAVFAGSAVYGVHANHACRQAIRAQAAIESDQIARYHCTTSPDGDFGSCSETEDGCERERAVFAVKHEMSACAAQLDVVCFSYGSLDGANHVACTPTAPSCGALHRGLERQPGITSIESCEERIASKPLPPPGPPAPRSP